jgi:hypothetical protein
MQNSKKFIKFVTDILVFGNWVRRWMDRQMEMVNITLKN